MKKYFLALTILAFAAAAKAQDKNRIEIKAVPQQWGIAPDSNLKGENGEILINVPEQTALSCIVSKTGEAKTFALHSGNPKEVKPGTYDVIFWGVKIPSVVVEKGKSTRIFTGTLKSTVKGLWEVWTTDGQKVYSAGGPKQVALPPGNYIMKTNGAEIKTTITDGKTSFFSFTGY